MPKHDRIIVPAFALFMALFVSYLANVQPFPVRVAAKCKGEASQLLPVCACVVRNRIAAGWGEGTVLSQFYAKNVTPTAEEVKIVDDVLKGKTFCDERFYFMFSLSDIYAQNYQNMPPIAKYVLGKNSEIWIYEKWFLKRK